MMAAFQIASIMLVRVIVLLAFMFAFTGMFLGVRFAPEQFGKIRKKSETKLLEKQKRFGGESIDFYCDTGQMQTKKL